MLDIIVENAKIVSQAGTYEGEIGIKDGIVSEVSKNVDEKAER